MAPALLSLWHMPHCFCRILRDEDAHCISGAGPAMQICPASSAAHVLPLGYPSGIELAMSSTRVAHMQVLCRGLNAFTLFSLSVVIQERPTRRVCSGTPARHGIRWDSTGLLRACTGRGAHGTHAVAGARGEGARPLAPYSQGEGKVYDDVLRVGTRGP